MLKQNKYYSYNNKELPKGCQYCVKGEKLVVFITGICPRKCCFCPVSDQKYQEDVTFANERKVDNFTDVVAEAEAMQAKGAGITGGDPLAKLERTLEYITKLKEKFGKEFHIHLYTSLNLVNEETLEKLFSVGLDEIRFHLDLDDDKLWDKLKLAKKFSWDVGVELPLIPGKKYIKLIDFIKDKVDFLNLNELETADNEQYNLSTEIKDNLSYAVKGSMELGLELLEKYPDMTIHLCTAKLKDKIQLSERIKREAQQVKHSFDIVDKEGMLTRGALYLEELKPGFDYRKKLEENNDALLDKFEKVLPRLRKKFAKDEFFLDMKKPRILTSKKLVKKKKAYFINLKLVPAVVTEYPTADQLEIEVEFLG
tara:strand:- start:5 stop:1108 length:1104 start_codon:yes stop_codon:yes gene_type:complete